MNWHYEQALIMNIFDSSKIYENYILVDTQVKSQIYC